jgi:hypothetical protein
MKQANEKRTSVVCFVFALAKRREINIPSKNKRKKFFSSSQAVLLAFLLGVTKENCANESRTRDTLSANPDGNRELERSQFHDLFKTLKVILTRKQH